MGKFQRQGRNISPPDLAFLWPPGTWEWPSRQDSFLFRKLKLGTRQPVQTLGGRSLPTSTYQDDQAAAVHV